jgi:hypothetical protein
MQKTMLVHILDANHHAVSRRKDHLRRIRRQAFGIAVQHCGDSSQSERPGG